VYIYGSFSTVLKWQGGDGNPIFKLLSVTPFVTIKKDTVTVAPATKDIGSYTISIEILDEQHTDTLNWPINILQGTGTLVYNWTDGLSNDVDTTRINLTNGSLMHSYSFPSCISVGSKSFTNIEAGTWTYKVIKGRLCNAPCPCSDTSAIFSGTVVIANGNPAQISY
jgi:hypothetical protein